jgi:hypothetical protein
MRLCEMCEQREAMREPATICRRCNLDVRWHIWFNADEGWTKPQLAVMEARLWLGELRWWLTQKVAAR